MFSFCFCYHRLCRIDNTLISSINNFKYVYVDVFPQSCVFGKGVVVDAGSKLEKEQIAAESFFM